MTSTKRGAAIVLAVQAGVYLIAAGPLIWLNKTRTSLGAFLLLLAITACTIGIWALASRGYLTKILKAAAAAVSCVVVLVVLGAAIYFAAKLAIAVIDALSVKQLMVGGFVLTGLLLFASRRRVNALKKQLEKIDTRMAAIESDAPSRRSLDRPIWEPGSN